MNKKVRILRLVNAHSCAEASHTQAVVLDLANVEKITLTTSAHNDDDLLDVKMRNPNTMLGPLISVRLLDLFLLLETPAQMHVRLCEILELPMPEATTSA